MHQSLRGKILRQKQTTRRAASQQQQQQQHQAQHIHTRLL
jgi:hypothetical protein